MDDFAHDAAAEGHDADDENQADHDGDRLPQDLEPFHPGGAAQEAAEFTDLVLEHDHNESAQHGAGEGAQAADQRHEDDHARHLPGGVRQRCRHEYQRLGRTCQARERSREYKAQQLEIVDVVAQRYGAWFVFAYGLEHLPEGRIDGAPADDVADKENGHDHVIQIQVVGQIQAEEIAARYALQAILAMRKRRLQEEEEHHLGHG